MLTLLFGCLLFPTIAPIIPPAVVAAAGLIVVGGIIYLVIKAVDSMQSAFEY